MYTQTAATLNINSSEKIKQVSQTDSGLDHLHTCTMYLSPLSLGTSTTLEACSYLYYRFTFHEKTTPLICTPHNCPIVEEYQLHNGYGCRHASTDYI